MNSVRFSGIDIAYRIMWMWPLYFRSPANAHTNTVLWNAMINPFLRSTIFGALWYQGMSNIQHKKTCKNPYILKKWILQIKIIKTQFVILLVVNFVSHSGCICTCSNYCALNFKLVGLGLGLWCLTPLSTYIFRIYLTIRTVAMPVITIEHTSVFPPSNCIIPWVAN
jgi:hypothetical protein